MRKYKTSWPNKKKKIDISQQLIKFKNSRKLHEFYLKES